MYFHEGVTRELQTLYTVFTRVSARGAHLILISQRGALIRGRRSFEHRRSFE